MYGKSNRIYSPTQVIETYQGESHRLLVQIKDSEGVVINPSAGAIHDIRIYLVHRSTFKVTAMWSKQAAAGYALLNTVQEPAPGDYKAECILNEAQSIEAQQGMYEIQIDLYVPNDKFDSGMQVFRQKGILLQLNPAVNGL